MLSGCRWAELRRSETPPAGVSSRAGNKYLRGQCVNKVDLVEGVGSKAKGQ